MDLALPRSQKELQETQKAGKRRAVERARRAPFFRDRLKGIDAERDWGEIPILDKETLRGLSAEQFYREFCTGPREDWREFWPPARPEALGSTGTAETCPGPARFRRVIACLPSAVDLASSVPLASILRAR